MRLSHLVFMFAGVVIFGVVFSTIGCCPQNQPAKIAVKIKSSTWETERGADWTNIVDEHDRTLRIRGTHDLKPGKSYDIELGENKRPRTITEVAIPQIQKSQVIKIEPSDKSGPRTFRVTVGADGKVQSEELPDEEIKLLKEAKK